MARKINLPIIVQKGKTKNKSKKPSSVKHKLKVKKNMTCLVINSTNRLAKVSVGYVSNDNDEHMSDTDYDKHYLEHNHEGRIDKTIKTKGALKYWTKQGLFRSSELRFV